jgi:hypothetical protein
MSKNNGKSVDYARTHGPLFVPNSGQFGPELDSTSSGSRVVSMEIDEPFLTVTIKDKVNKLVTIPIPLANLSHMRVAPTVEKNSK